MGRKHYQLLGLQLILLVVAAGVIVVLRNTASFLAVLGGGAAWFLPNSYFQWRMRHTKVINNNLKMLKYFFASEVIKLVLSFGMVAVLLLIYPINSASFCGGYIIMILVSLIVPMRYRRQHG